MIEGNRLIQEQVFGVVERMEYISAGSGTQSPGERFIKCVGREGNRDRPRPREEKPEIWLGKRIQSGRVANVL
jgi:hypothetical protein